MSQIELTAPSGEGEGGQGWEVRAKNLRVNKSWQALLERSPENAARCYQHLKNSPRQRIPGRVFPLRGKKYKGCWEYEVTGGDRVFYTVDAEKKVVLVYYADEHPKPPAPTP